MPQPPQVLGALAASTPLVLRITVGDLMTAPAWAWSLFLGALILGITGTVFGVLAALRSAQHRLLAFVCLAINLAADLAAFAVAAYR